MNSADQIALVLLNKLLAGERGIAPLQLAMLLEKSARLARGDEPSQVEADYKDILLPEFIGISVSPPISEEIIARLCIEMSKDPDQALISAIATTGTKTAIKTVVRLLVAPPRALKSDELTVAFSCLSTFLPIYRAESPGLISPEEIAGLSKLAEGVLASEESGGSEVERRVVREQATRLLERLQGAPPLPKP